jgi:DNA-directed RNA polymerase beta' subunit
MVLGLYYITKIRPGAKGEGLTFYGPEEAIIAFNEKKVDVHAPIKVVVEDLDETGMLIKKMVETSVGRVIVNEIIPREVGFVNTIISKKSLRNIITTVIKGVGMARAAEFLDGIKNLGYRMAYEGGLSFNLDDIIIGNIPIIIAIPKANDSIMVSVQVSNKHSGMQSIIGIRFVQHRQLIVHSTKHMNFSLVTILKEMADIFSIRLNAYICIHCS